MFVYFSTHFGETENNIKIQRSGFIEPLVAMWNAYYEVLKC